MQLPPETNTLSQQFIKLLEAVCVVLTGILVGLIGSLVGVGAAKLTLAIAGAI